MLISQFAPIPFWLDDSYLAVPEIAIDDITIIYGLFSSICLSKSWFNCRPTTLVKYKHIVMRTACEYMDTFTVWFEVKFQHIAGTE